MWVMLFLPPCRTWDAGSIACRIDDANVCWLRMSWGQRSEPDWVLNLTFDGSPSFCDCWSVPKPDQSFWAPLISVSGPSVCGGLESKWSRNQPSESRRASMTSFKGSCREPAPPAGHPNNGWNKPGDKLQQGEFTFFKLAFNYHKRNRNCFSWD